jgi:hypothetical protein
MPLAELVLLVLMRLVLKGAGGALWEFPFGPVAAPLFEPSALEVPGFEPP